MPDSHFFRYGSLLFPSFEAGVGFMIEVAQRRLQPASVRLIDNEQFHMGHALKEEVGSQFTAIMDAIKTFYVTKIKGFDKVPSEIVPHTISATIPRILPRFYNLGRTYAFGIIFALPSSLASTNTGYTVPGGVITLLDIPC